VTLIVDDLGIAASNHTGNSPDPAVDDVVIQGEI
jgi:hypothetical protein